MTKVEKKIIKKIGNIFSNINPAKMFVYTISTVVLVMCLLLILYSIVSNSDIYSKIYVFWFTSIALMVVIAIIKVFVDCD